MSERWDGMRIGWWGRAALGLALLLGSGATHRVAAQTPLTLSEAVARSLDRDPRLGAARARLDGARATVQIARSGLYPRLSVTGSLSGSRAPSRFNPGAELRDAYTTGLALDQVVFQPGAFALLDVAEASRELADVAAETVSRQVAFDAIDAYYGAVRSARLVAVQSQALRSATQAATEVRARVTVGAVPRVDLLRAEVQQALAETERRRAEADLAVARLRLTTLTGLPAEAVTPDTTLAAPDSVTLSIDRLMALAEATSPALRTAAIQIAQEESGVRALRWTYLPTLALRAGAGFQQSELNPASDYQTLTLSLAWPLFTGGLRRGQLRLAQAEARAATATALTVRDELRLSLAANLTTWTDAIARARLAAQSTEAAREALRITQAAYTEGAATLVEVFTAQADLARTEANRVTAWTEAQIARARIEQTIGRTLAANGEPGD